MALDIDRSIFQGTDIEPGLQLNTNGEILARLMPIDWDQIPSTNVQIYLSLSPTIGGPNSIRYRLRQGVPQPNPVNVGTLGVNIRAETTLAPGGPYDTLLTSASFAKPTGLDCLQMTAEGIPAANNSNSTGTVEMGIIPDVDDLIVAACSLRGGYQNQPAPEVIVTQYLIDYTRFTSTNVRATIACHYTNSNFGNATLNLRQGGTYNVADGTILAGTTTIPIFFNGYISLSAVYARPAGTEMLKISQAGPFIQNVTTPTIWVQEA